VKAHSIVKYVCMQRKFWGKVQLARVERSM
jgi:hypothetical protein